MDMIATTFDMRAPFEGWRLRSGDRTVTTKELQWSATSAERRTFERDFQAERRAGLVSTRLERASSSVSPWVLAPGSSSTKAPRLQCNKRLLVIMAARGGCLQSSRDRRANTQC